MLNLPLISSISYTSQVGGFHIVGFLSTHPTTSKTKRLLCDPDVPSDKVSIRLGLNWARNLVRKPKRPLALTPKVKTCVVRFVSCGFGNGKKNDLGK